MRLLRRSIWLLGIAACSSEPTALDGLRIRVEPNAAVLPAGDALRVRVTVTNESSEPQRVAGLSCYANVDVFDTATNTVLPVYDNRMCAAVAGSALLPPHGSLSDVLTFATTRMTGAENALSEGTYRLRGQFGLIGRGLLRSDYVIVTVSR